MITSWEDLSIGKYLELCEVMQTPADDSVGLIDKEMKAVAIISGKAFDEIETMTISEYGELKKCLAFLETDMPKREVKRSLKYEVGDWVLVPSVEIGAMTTAQYIDFQTFGKDPAKNLIELLAVFLVPENHVYRKGYDVGRVKEVIRDKMSVVDATSLSAFFFKKCTDSIRSLATSLERATMLMPKDKKRTARKMIQQLREALAKGGVGFTR